MSQFDSKERCYVCAADVPTNDLVCERHREEWTTFSSNEVFTKRAQRMNEWGDAAPRKAPPYRLTSLREWAANHHEAKPCPKCGTNLVAPDDYLCEGCRYG